LIAHDYLVLKFSAIKSFQDIAKKPINYLNKFGKKSIFNSAVPAGIDPANFVKIAYLIFT
jgi:hypothetical protein